MLKNNILPKKTKLISIVMLIIFITYICASRFLQMKSYAAQTTESYSSSKISKYPGYKELIDNLKSKYPELECFMNREPFDDNLKCKLHQSLQALLVQMEECISFEDTSDNTVTFFNEYSNCPLTIELVHEKIVK